MSRKPTDDNQNILSRRNFMGAVVTAGAGAAAGGLILPESARAEVMFPKDRTEFGAGGEANPGGPYRSENDLYDCEVEGSIPKDLDGTWFRVGPDPQYPKPDKYAHDIMFDGEGHVGAFRIKDGHVDFRSRYPRTQRYMAQREARRSLFGMYRNPTTDDPSVKGLSRGTANTQIFYHHGKLLAFKEDSPPVAMHPLTLETTDAAYNFGGGMKSLTHTAHPKIDSETGEYIAFGYEAKGLATDDIFVFSADKAGKVNWNAWIKVPYAGMIHDFAVTQKHVVFYVVPLATNMDLINGTNPAFNGPGPHFAWDSTLPTWFGVMRRGGDGKDLRWYKGPGYMCTHVMGCWSDGDKVTVDMDGGESNQFPFFPQLHEKFDPVKGAGHVMRFTVDLKNKRQTTYNIEKMYPDVAGALSRQDDRYHTVPYRYGFLLSSDPQAGARWAMFDHQKRAVSYFGLGRDAALAEMTFVPRKKGAPEGDGYLIGVASYRKEGGRSDVVLVDTQHLDAGPVATIHLPYRLAPQIHGFWAAGEDLPAA